MKALRFFLICLFFCASAVMLFVSLSSAQAGGGNIYCKDVFPGTCTQGGCGAISGWTAQDCVIYCAKDRNGFWNTITCERPSAI